MLFILAAGAAFFLFWALSLSPPFRIHEAPTRQEPGSAECLEQALGGRAFMLGCRADANRISLEELDLIPGIGQKSAERLINFIKERGGIIEASELDGIDVPLGRIQQAEASVYLY